MAKRSKIPLCKHCKTVHLVSYMRRRAGICTECERRARRGVCPDCGGSLGAPEFENTLFAMCFVYARCRGCQVLFMTYDGKEWIQAAYDDDLEDKE